MRKKNKKCRDCQIDLPQNHPLPKGKRCEKCYKEHIKKWRIENKEKIKQSRKKWADANRDVVNAVYKRWRDKNKEHYNEYHRLYQLNWIKNKEKEND